MQTSRIAPPLPPEVLVTVLGLLADGEADIVQLDVGVSVLAADVVHEQVQVSLLARLTERWDRSRPSAPDWRWRKGDANRDVLTPSAFVATGLRGFIARLGDHGQRPALLRLVQSQVKAQRVCKKQPQNEVTAVDPVADGDEQQQAQRVSELADHDDRARKVSVMP
jgi:hypothetical protein